MFIALVGNDGFIEMIGPQAIVRAAPCAGGTLVTLSDGRSIASLDDMATLRRRVRAVGPSAPGRTRLLRRLWIADVWHTARAHLRLPLRRAAR